MLRYPFAMHLATWSSLQLSSYESSPWEANPVSETCEERRRRRDGVRRSKGRARGRRREDARRRVESRGRGKTVWALYQRSM